MVSTASVLPLCQQVQRGVSAPLQARYACAGPEAAGQVKLPQRLQLVLAKCACAQDLQRRALPSAMRAGPGYASCRPPHT